MSNNINYQELWFEIEYQIVGCRQYYDSTQEISLF